MTTLGLWVTVACALSWASLDVLRKQLIVRIDALALVVWLALAQLPFLSAWVWLGPEVAIESGYVPWLLIGVALNVAANLLYLGAIARGRFSVAIPLLAFVPVWTALFGIPLLHQVPSVAQFVGIAVVVLGALLLHGGIGRRGLLGLVREPSSLMMLGVSLCWSLTVVVDRRATAHAPLGFHALALNVGIAVAVSGWMLATGRLGELAQIRRAPVRLGLAGAVAAGALGLQLWAIQLVFVSVLEAIKRAIGMVGALVFGRLAFGEPVTGGKWLAIGLMAMGSSLVIGLWG